MITAALVWSTIEAGAAIMASEAVKDATKEAYSALRTRVMSHFGGRVGTALAKVEGEPGSNEAKHALSAVIPSMTPADAEAIGPQLTALIHAMQADPAAKPTLERAQIRFDLHAEGNVLIGEIQNAQSIDMKATAGQDIRLDRLNMADRNDRGN